MTAQITDTVFYQNSKHEIVGIKGKGLIDPTNFGLNPIMIHTACYRGYYLEYSVLNDKLLLTRMNVKDSNETYPPISGVEPSLLYYESHDGEKRERSERCYEGLRVPVPFSGGLLIARDFIREMYVHMGFQKPTSFRAVHELLVDNGNITRMIDHSESVSKLRRKMQGQSPEPDDLMGWINDMFSLDYFI
ncbi:MAG: hypothetical protein L0154_13170 [Chloroflexi bacterium]|nr:hypothetical protein [Chloroflexota bacterium]